MLAMISPWEIGIILVVVLLLFGKQLPSLMRSIGKSIPEFKKGISDDTGENRPPTEK